MTVSLVKLCDVIVCTGIVYSLQSTKTLTVSCTVSAVSGHLLYCVRSLWSSPVLCPQSLVISCTVSAVLWSSPVLCPQSLVISCTVSAVSGHPCTVSAVSGHLLYCVRCLWSSGHLLYCVCSLWSSPVLCPQSLVISCTVSAVSGHLILWSQSLVSCTVSAVSGPSMSCTVSAVSGHPL
ncbi:unnamed protein product, partial [Staurois parvus]